MSYFSSIIDGIPRVISAVILLLIAFAVASIVKYLVVQARKKINAEKYTDKLGITDEKTGSSVEFLGKLAFLIVFVLFLTGVFENWEWTGLLHPFHQWCPNLLIIFPTL